MAEPSPLALRLAPGLMKALVRLALPHELVLALGPALDGLDWTFDAAAGLVRDRLTKKEALERAKVLVEAQIAGLLSALAAEGVALDSEQANVAVGLLDSAVARVGATRAALLVGADVSAPAVAARLREAISAELQVTDGPVKTTTERLILAASESLVQTASSREGFLECAVAALLAKARRTELATRDLPAMYAYLRCALPPSAESDAAFRARMVGAVARSTAYLRLPGLPEDAISVEEAVFITAQVGLAGGVSSRVPELCGRNGRLLLVGPAGSGKSTQLVNLCHSLATARVGAPDALAGRVPFFLPLRAFAERDFPDPRGLIAWAAPNFADEAPRGWASRTLERGALLAFDGLDELPRGRRRDFFHWLKALARDFDGGSGLAMVVSSRPSALMGPAGELLVGAREWPVAHLDALGEPARDHLIRGYCGWIAAYRHQPDQAESVLNLVRGSLGLVLLAKNPLLTCLVAQTAADGVLPSRAHVCVAAAKTVLWRPISDDLPLDLGARFEVVSALAAWFQENEHVVAPLAEVDAFLGSLAPSVGGATLRQELVELTGLLTYERGGVSFQHRALQHSLAAAHILRTARFGFLAGVAHRPDWRDVVEDTLALATGESRQALLNRLRAAAHRKPVVAGLLAGV